MHDPFTRESYSRDPRNVARKAEEYLVSTGIADTAFFGAEAEFYIFDSVRYDSGMNSAFYELDSISGSWNTGAETNADGSPPNLATRFAPRVATSPPSLRTTTTWTCATKSPPT